MKIVLLEPGAADLVRFLKVKFCSSDNSRPHGFVVLVWNATSNRLHLLKWVQICPNVFICVQTCSKLVQVLLYVFKCVQMCSFVFKLVQNLFKCVQMWPNLFKTRSNVLKCVQTCSELVQMCSFHIRSNLFKTFSNVMYQGYNSILL